MTGPPVVDDHPFSQIPQEVDTLIIGAGPTGLGAAIRAEQHGHKDWVLVDSSDGPGGLACTDSTPEGFIFDMGGHVIFSHYAYFDQVIDHAVGACNWETHQRISYVWIKDRWVPYPFQNNLFCLPDEDKVRCINGVIDATLQGQLTKSKPDNFEEWILKVMGRGIADLFMLPYNFKVWACEPRDMQCSWLGERVATVDLKRVTESVILNKPDAGWGPNAVFRFPRTGGTGHVWTSVSALLPRDKLVFSRSLVDLDFEAQKASFSDGSVCHYNRMISTAPLDIMLDWVKRPDLAAHLKYSSTHVIGIGIRGTSPHEKKCWMYFPESNCPFYRCTVFSLYAESNCPDHTVLLPTLRCADAASACMSSEPKTGPYWSLMFEVSESAAKPVNMTTIVEETIQGAINTRLIDAADEIVSIYDKRLERGYPTPSLERDKGVTEGLKMLKQKNVWSRGRFGAWKYEVGNQDHSLMQGVEAVDNILFGACEMTLEYPDVVNGRGNEDILFARPAGMNKRA